MWTKQNKLGIILLVLSIFFDGMNCGLPFQLDDLTKTLHKQSTRLINNSGVGIFDSIAHVIKDPKKAVSDLKKAAGKTFNGTDEDEETTEEQKCKLVEGLWHASKGLVGNHERPRSTCVFPYTKDGCFSYCAFHDGITQAGYYDDIKSMPDEKKLNKFLNSKYDEILFAKGCQCHKNQTAIHERDKYMFGDRIFIQVNPDQIPQERTIIPKIIYNAFHEEEEEEVEVEEEEKTPSPAEEEKRARLKADEERRKAEEEERARRKAKEESSAAGRAKRREGRRAQRDAEAVRRA